MSAASGLAPSQFRAMGIIVGALYLLYAIRGVATQLQVRPEVAWGTVLVAALVWLPGVVALPAFATKHYAMGRRALRVAALVFPIGILLWPLVSLRDGVSRLDFWVHSIPGLAAVAALVTLPRAVAWAVLILNCLLVEVVMREIGIVDTWSDSLVRLAFAWVYALFFFVLVLSMLRDIERANQFLERSSREQTEAAVLQAREEEVSRLDRLTHDFVLSLLSAAAEGVPNDKLRVQAETVRRRLGQAAPDETDLDTVEDMVARIVRRCERYGVPINTEAAATDVVLPRLAALEIEAAVEEAVRNTIRHSTGGSRVVISDHGVTIRICDDGPGFDPDTVRERLGVTQSILHRMNSLPDGSAAIDSAPGRGTVVTIRWCPT